MSYTTYQTRSWNSDLRQVPAKRGSRHPLIDNLAAERRLWQVSGILTILSGMFVILVNGTIHRRDEAEGGRTGCGESGKVYE